MSLIHWWPLNGNLKDYGIKGTSKGSGGTSTNNGKIGKCYEAKNANYISLPFTCETTDTYTISMWLKIPTSMSSNTGWETFFYYSCVNGETASNIYANWANYQALKIYDDSNHQYRWLYPNTNFNYDEWFHLTIVHTPDSSQTTKFYINGTLLGSNTSSTTLSIRSGEFRIGGGVTVGSFFINDLRVYNHALSVKEIHELAKGLVLHYTFEDAYAEGTTNIRPWSSTITSTTITGWDASKNDGATAYTRSGWSYGYNSGVPSPSAGYHAHWVYLEGELVMKFPNLNSEIGQTGRWLGISGGITLPWHAGDKYTISWEQKTDNLELAPWGGIYYKLTSSSSNAFNDGYPTFGKSTKVNVWERKSYTFTVNSNYDGSVTSASIYIYGGTGPATKEGTFYVRNVQVEYKDHVTPFVADSRAAGKIYDSSGLGNNGTVNGVLQIVSDSGCGEHSGKFNGSDTSIQTPNLSLMVPEGNFTILGWFKHTDEWSSKNYETLYGGPGGFEIEAKYGGTNSPMFVAYNWGGNSSTDQRYAYTLNVWHQFAMVRNSSGTTWFMDGVQIFTGTASSIPSGNYFIGSWNTSSSQNFKGYIADFKIFATNLSASDILAEYNRKAAIDRSGNLFTGEFVSSNSKTNIDKNNIVYSASFVEGDSKTKIFGGYTQLEYIQSDTGGYAYINTLCPIYSGNSWRVEMELMMGDTWFSGYQSIFNSTLNSDTFESWINNISNKGNLNVRYNDNALRDIVQMEPGNKYKVVFNYANTTLNAYVNSEFKKTTTIAKTTRDVSSVYLTLGHSYDATTFKYYDVKLYTDGVLLRHFIPAKRNKDNALGMFDLIEGKFYTNSGSGSFIAGQELGELSLIRTNQLIED